MTQKKKAELQRRLSVAQVPEPPDGLSERIKADIPKYLLDTERDRSRLSRSMNFNLRVAASIFVLLGGAFLIIAVLSGTGSRDAQVASQSPSAASPMVVADQVQEVDAKLSQAPPAARSQALDVGNAQSPGEEAQKEEAKKNDGDLDSFRERRRQKAAIGSVSGGRDEREAKLNAIATSEYSVAQRPAAPPALASPQPAPPAEPAPARAAAQGRKDSEETIVVTADAPPPADTTAAKSARPQAGLMRDAVASSITVPDRSRVFGISVDPFAFSRLRTTIERGAQPEPGAVDVEALVNYFAGPPPRRGLRDVRMDVEVTSAPTTSGLCCVLRITIDTPINGSTLPLAKNALLEVAFDRKAVSEFTRAGGDESTTLVQPVLFPNTSVTALYHFQLQPTPSRRKPIATVTLRYESLPQGKERTVVKKIVLSDINESWTTGSRRHRLASLGALWGQSLKDSAREAEIARKAEELAKQEPLDPRARELAAAAGRLQEKSQEQK